MLDSAIAKMWNCIQAKSPSHVQVANTCPGNILPLPPNLKSKAYSHIEANTDFVNFFGHKLLLRQKSQIYLCLSIELCVISQPAEIQQKCKCSGGRSLSRVFSMFIQDLFYDDNIILSSSFGEQIVDLPLTFDQRLIHLPQFDTLLLKKGVWA